MKAARFHDERRGQIVTPGGRCNWGFPHLTAHRILKILGSDPGNILQDKRSQLFHREISEQGSSSWHLEWESKWLYFLKSLYCKLSASTFPLKAVAASATSYMIIIQESFFKAIFNLALIQFQAWSCLYARVCLTLSLWTGLLNLAKTWLICNELQVAWNLAGWISFLQLHNGLTPYNHSFAGSVFRS